jgi:hypothetical protein
MHYKGSPGTRESHMLPCENAVRGTDPERINSRRIEKDLLPYARYERVSHQGIR